MGTLIKVGSILILDMTVTVREMDKSYQDLIGRGIIERIFDRPALLIFLFYLFLIYIMQLIVTNQQALLIPNALLLSAVLPAIILEHRWIGKVKKGERNSRLFFDIVKANRSGFIFSGFLSSLLFLTIAYIFGIFLVNPLQSKVLFGNYYILYSVNLSHIIAIILSSIISGGIIAATFFRVRGEEHDTGRRYTFLSTPAQITTFSSYSLIGLFSTLWVLWMGQLIISPLIGSQRQNVETITGGTFSFVIMIVFTLYLAIAYAANEIPKITNGPQYRIPDRSIILKWIRDITIFTIIASTFIQNRLVQVKYFYTDSMLSIDLITYLMFPILYLLMIRKQPMSGKTCRSCNLIKYEEACLACDSRDHISIPFKFKKKRQIRHPSCPSCGTKWVNLTRTCSNESCKFKIELSCEHCGNKINPLWKKCAHCDKERVSIVNKALQAPGSEGFARSIAYIRIIMAILVPIFIMQISLLIRTIIELEEDNINISLAYLVYSLTIGITRLLLIFFAFVGTLGVLFATTREKKRPLGLIANRHALISVIILMQSIFFIFVFNSFGNLDNQGRIYLFSKILVVILSLFFLFGSIMGNYKTLLTFRPITPFDPKLSLDRRIE